MTQNRGNCIDVLKSGVFVWFFCVLCDFKTEFLFNTAENLKNFYSAYPKPLRFL
nr:MAG TPA: hypothetical protein [Caudoviricetes sp.]